jgi:hypothetical protein
MRSPNASKYFRRRYRICTAAIMLASGGLFHVALMIILCNEIGPQDRLNSGLANRREPQLANSPVIAPRCHQDAFSAWHVVGLTRF